MKRMAYCGFSNKLAFLTETVNVKSVLHGQKKKGRDILGQWTL